MHTTTSDTQDEFVRLAEAARIAKMSTATLLRRHRAGHELGIRKCGRIVLVHTPSLLTYLRTVSTSATM